MKKVYGEFPSQQKTVLREVSALSRYLGVEPPLIKFWSRGDAKYETDKRLITIPDLNWMEEHTECPVQEYWTVLFHEFAHYLDHVWHGNAGHTPTMYAILVALSLYTDLPLNAFYDDEHSYKPVAFRRGRIRAGKMLLGSLSRP